MDKFIVSGGHTLSGEITVSGAKNAVLPIMAACLLHPDKYTLHNVPDLRDTRTMVRLLEIIGARVSFDRHVMVIDSSDCHNPEAPYDLVKTMRASFYVLGPLLARFGSCKVSLPGGCNWGPRPVDLHLKAMEALGANIDLKEGYIHAQGRLKGAVIDFPVSSVGATGNAMMAAVLADGETIIHNAALEPEITALGEFLCRMGASIEGLGTRSLRISGGRELHGIEEEIIPDRIEAGTFLIAGALLGDRMRVKGVRSQDLEALLARLGEAGVELQNEDGHLVVSRPANIRPVDIVTAPFPGYPTDLQAQWITFMTQAGGASHVRDDIYLDRFSHVPELVRLGARVTVEQNVALVEGPAQLVGAPVMSTDIRASAAIILAALLAQGTTEIARVYHIDRGYEAIERKFARLGAKIERIVA
ncbi:MAG: UDP-N-acetylglucosamine 1-carboxyvinyltransferase [Candidatus Marinimicrobia bacterium]|nr:UDP-N-acetylglucosamine 1-carboxyvinyltransferase [Candidatus Neomarinimicrobiota bacterium]